jgi:hypothetical protein
MKDLLVGGGDPGKRDAAFFISSITILVASNEPWENEGDQDLADS